MKKKDIEKILKWFSMMENDEYKFPKTKKELFELERLDLCCFCNRVPKEISQVKNIKKLIVHIGGIKGPLPKEIKYFKHLEELNLGITFLEKLHVNLYKLEKLKTLNVAGNFIVDIPKGISRLENLEELDLSLYMGKIPKDIVKLNKLKKIKVSTTKYFTPTQKEWANNINIIES
jgi:Leucine-rich repeat (LRR) protein